MSTIKCSCGYPNCSTQINIYNQGSGTVDLVVSNDVEKERRVSLDANSIVRLIQELKNELAKLA